MHVTIFLCENVRADNIMMFDFVHCIDKGLGQSLRFPGTGSKELMTSLSLYTRSTVRGQLTAVDPFRILSHPILWFFLFLLLPVWWTILQCASWVNVSVAALAASWWPNWYRRCCCVPESDLLEEVLIDPLDLDLRSLCWGVSIAMVRCCGIEEEHDNKKKLGVLRNI